MTEHPYSQRFAKFLSERLAELDLRAEDVQERGGPSARMVYAYKAGRMPARPQVATLTGLDHALEWSTGSCAAILEGGVPTPVVADVPAPAQYRWLYWESPGAEPEARVLVEPSRVLNIAPLVRIAAEHIEALTDDCPGVIEAKRAARECRVAFGELVIEVAEARSFRPGNCNRAGVEGPIPGTNGGVNPNVERGPNDSALPVE